MICSDEARQAGLGDLVTAELSKAGNLQLVERDELEAATRELQLAAAMESQAAATRLKMGQLLKADGLLFLSVEGSKELRTLKVVVSESLCGARLRIEYLPYGRRRRRAVAALRRYRRRRPRALRRRDPSDRRRLAAVIEKSGPRLRPLAKRLREAFGSRPDDRSQRGGDRNRRGPGHRRRAVADRCRARGSAHASASRGRVHRFPRATGKNRTSSSSSFARRREASGGQSTLRRCRFPPRHASSSTICRGNYCCTKTTSRARMSRPKSNSSGWSPAERRSRKWGHGSRAWSCWKRPCCCRKTTSTCD